jgi:hypothetical protein
MAPNAQEKPRGSVWSIVLAGVVGMTFFIGAIFLFSAFGMVVLGIGVVVGGICVVAFFHYLVWGYWLGDSIRREVEEEERSNK